MVHKFWTAFSCQRVIHALKECLLDCPKRVCVVHLERNLKRKFSGPELKILLWKAVNAYNIWDNEEAFHQLQEASSATYAWLMKEPKEHWGRYLFDKSTAFADNSSNFVESFNKVINTLREKPSLTCLKALGSKL